MVNVKKGDFVKLSYIGKIKANNKIFDLTDVELAKKENLFNKNMQYGPITVCIGEAHVVKGLDEAIEGKEIGKSYTIELNPEKAFGKKDPKLMKIVSKGAFKDKDFVPFPGLQLNVDGAIATIRSVTGGRVILDFNNPLAGRDVVYEIKIESKVIDLNEKVDCLINFNLAIKPEKKEVKEGTLILTYKAEPPKELKEKFEKKVKELLPEIKKIDFIKPQEEKPTKAEKPK